MGLSIFSKIPTFLQGFARALDLGCTLNRYHLALEGNEADRQALMSDWSQVGLDIAYAMDQFEQDENDEKD